MPVYNGADTICTALDSLLAQTFTGFELFISDNASTDGTEDISIRYAKKDTRLNYTKNTDNIGACANFNKLIDHCSSEFFMWAAHDDTWEPRFLEEMVRLLRENPTAVLSFCDYDIWDIETGRRYSRPRILRHFAKPNSAFLRAALFLLSPEGRYKSTLIYGLIRSTAIQETGGFCANFYGEQYALDNHTLFRLGQLGSISLSPMILFHKGFTTNKSDLRGLPSRTEIFMSYKSYTRQIEESSFSQVQKTCLQTLAVYNLARAIVFNLIETNLIKWSHVPLISRLYGRFTPGE
jgi:glycosyltransferase involved in cell wall biosynthesis